MNSVTLVASGQPQSRIVLSADAAPAERHAAHELQAHLQQISGALVPITDASSPDEANIYLGKTPQSEALVGAFDWPGLGDDGCVVRTVEKGLVLASATPRGTLYAVYEFLEEVLDCRWLAADYSVIPQQQTITVSDLDIVHKPLMRYRETFFSVAENGDWAARNRTNSAHADLDEAHGGKWSYAGFVHTFYELVPPEKYFRSHPEYFSEIEGERTASGAQLCLSNPEVAGVATAAARRKLLEQPEARILSVSQNDWYGSCQCAACRAIDEEEGSPSGAIVRFVNTIAENLESEFPHVFFDTLAYTYSVAPPRQARPRHNVIIRLCHMSPCCDGHPVETCELNSKFLGYLQGWGEIAPEVFIWDYYTNFLHYFMPFPNLDAVCADVPLFARSGVTGLFCQGDGQPPKGSGEFTELRAYLLAKLMWRPERAGQAIINEFLQLYYGPAAGSIKKYIDLIHAPVRAGNAHFELYCSLDQPFLTPELMAQAEAIFDEAALLVAHDAVLSDHVAMARLPVEYMHIKHHSQLVIDGNRLKPAEPHEIERAQSFFDRAALHGAVALKEGGRPFSAEMRILRGFELVTLEEAGLKLVIGPAIGGRLVSLIDPVSGEEWLHIPETHATDYPFAGGYEEYSQAQWHSPGWTETYAHQESTSSAQLSAVLSNHLKLERTYRIEAGETPSLVIESFLTNTAAGVRPALLRAHPEFAGSLTNCHIQVRAADGSWQQIAPWENNANNIAPQTGSIWLKETEVPAGSWALVRGERKLCIEFEIAQVEKCLIDWRGVDNIISMELFSHSHQLEPGQAMACTQRWIVGNT